MLPMPEENYSLTLAGCDLEELGHAVSDQLRGAGADELAKAVEACAFDVGSALWGVERRTSRRKTKRIVAAESAALRMRQLLDESTARLPSLEESLQSGKELVVYILREIDRLTSAPQ